MADLLGIETAIEAVNAKTIPLLESAVQRQVDRLPKLIGDQVNLFMAQESNIVKAVLDSIASDLDKLDFMVKRVEGLLSRIDGATITLGKGAQ